MTLLCFARPRCAVPASRETATWNATQRTEERERGESRTAPARWAPPGWLAPAHCRRRPSSACRGHTAVCACVRECERGRASHSGRSIGRVSRCGLGIRKPRRRLLHALTRNRTLLGIFASLWLSFTHLAAACPFRGGSCDGAGQPRGSIRGRDRPPSSRSGFRRDDRFVLGSSRPRRIGSFRRGVLYPPQHIA